jgi:hypothetical protein
VYKCKYCGKEFEKCGSLGAHVLCMHNVEFRRKQRLPRRLREVITRQCAVCGCKFSYEKIVGSKKGDRKCCSVSCAARRYPTNVNVCLCCGKNIDRHLKFCSLKCCYEYKRQEYIKKWLKGEVSGNTKDDLSNHVRKYLFEINNNKCEKCGWNEVNKLTGLVPLEIHHKDGNSGNSKRENVELLCPNCHSLTFNYGGLNVGNGRECRRLSRQEHKLGIIHIKRSIKIKKNCLLCNKEFFVFPSRSKRKYCSHKCALSSPKRVSYTTSGMALLSSSSDNVSTTVL